MDSGNTHNQSNVSLGIDTSEESKIVNKEKKSKRSKKTNKNKKSKNKKKNDNKQISKNKKSYKSKGSKKNMDETEENCTVNTPYTKAWKFKASLYDRDSKFEESYDEEFIHEQEEIFEILKQIENSKPECKICFEKIDFEDIIPLDVCPHKFHKECMTGHIEQKVDSKNFPIDCPEWRKELDNMNIKQFWDQKLFEKFIDFQFQSFVEQKDLMMHCPTPDWEFVFEWVDDEDRNQKFAWIVCKKAYCLHCRVEWHEGLTWSGYK